MRHVVCLAIVLSFGTNSWAVDGAEIFLTVTSDSIYPGTPLGMELRVVGDSKAVAPLRAVFINNDDLHIRIKDGSGAVVRESKPWPWRCHLEPRHIWLAELGEATGWQAKRYLVLNEWCSTNLPPGEYRAECELTEIGPVRVGEVSSERVFPKPPIVLEFPFRVLQQNDEEAQKVYRKLLKAASSPVTTIERQVELARNVELIVYSREIQALPAQSEILSGIVPMFATVFNSCNAIDLTVYLAQQDRLEVAEGLLSTLDKLNSEKSEMLPGTREILTDLVVWAIYEMHERGVPEIVAITEPIVQAHPKPADPRERLY